MWQCIKNTVWKDGIKIILVLKVVQEVGMLKGIILYSD